MKDKLKHRTSGCKPPKTHAWHYQMQFSKEKVNEWVFTKPKKDIYSYAN